LSEQQSDPTAPPSDLSSPLPDPTAPRFDPTAPLQPSGNLRRREAVSSLVAFGARAAALLALAVLMIVLYTVFKRGAGSLSLDFLTKSPPLFGGAGGGIGPELVGTIIIVALAAGIHTRWVMLSALGVIGILAGILAFFFPGPTALTIVLIIGVWAIIRGAAEIAAAVQLRKVIPNEWALVLAGVLSVLFGVLLLAKPAVGLISVIFIVGIYALLAGILLVIAAFRVKSHSWAV